MQGDKGQMVSFYLLRTFKKNCNNEQIIYKICQMFIIKCVKYNYTHVFKQGPVGSEGIQGSSGRTGILNNN